ncbi:hypothetical protein Syn7502_01512 [Synechococcus sp. PCC 7502]|uniref:DUF305 domain-containing protein n=1 Tax=Synechococcus sp. PCC 7502 TaxID=1173263 RepID=UPI00029FD63F|nr:DUF305 domain-containing protein [Synechococcus sp. PCC 7502]AFY73580.1 hypothetical protein Syn7502_01512 [Synechococcus sp. PCC 7502]
MNKKFLVYSLVGLLSSVAATGFELANSIQAQSLPPSKNPQTMRSVQVDQHFIEMMIPHHQDAIAMADIALTRTKRPEVKKLAEAIKKDQAREVQEMRTWYKQWYGKEVPLTSMNMASMNMGMMGNSAMQGTPMMGMGKDMMNMGQDMMKPNSMMGRGQEMMNMGQNMMSMGQNMMTMDIEALKTASDFDKEFVRQMVPHHQMAVMMAQMAINRATRPETRTLAQSIIKSQNAEIAQMQGWQIAWNR